jgi:hypothetical protein
MFTNHLKTLFVSFLISLTFLSGCDSVSQNQSIDDISNSENIGEASNQEEIVETTEDPFITLSEIDGDVFAKQADESEFAIVSDGFVLSINGAVETKDDSHVKLSYSDGTIVRVGPNSLFELTVIEQEEDGGLLKKLFLETGQLWVALNGGSLEVDTEAGVASVRGSYLSTYFDSVTGFLHITCLEGDCTFGEGENTVSFSAGETVTVDAPGLIPFLASMSIEDLENWLNNSPEAQELLNEFAECAILVEGDILLEDLWTCYISLGNDDFTPPEGEIGDYVWEDMDGDGIQDEFEPPLAEIPVTLFNMDNEIIETNSTNENGEYLFDNIPAGNYYLQFDAPEGFVFTELEAGDDRTVDNDTDEEGYTEPFLLPGGTFIDTLDAGLVFPGSAGVTCPLTGQTIDDEALLALRPIFISISHFPPKATRPSTGINSAPIVFESVLDAGQTRLQALFYCSYPSEFPDVENGGDDGSSNIEVYEIEGVRSGRVFYTEYAKLFNAGLIIKGADSQVLSQILAYTCSFATLRDENNVGSGGLNISKLMAVAEDCLSPAGNTDLSIWNFGPPSPGGEPTPNFQMIYNYLNQTRWDYDESAGGYVRSQNTPDAPEEFTVSTDRLTGDPNVRQNVLVLITQHNVQNPAGSIIEFTITNTRGYGYLLRDGLRYNICWSTVNGDYEASSVLYRPFIVYDCATKEEIPMSPGQTWINVVDTTTSFDNAYGYWRARHYQPTYTP